MGMPLRITFQDIDYNFRVVNKGPITKSTVEIPIILNGENLTLVKGLRGWNLKETASDVNTDLVQSIGRAIELRLRL